jgi:hypothetical protein
MLQTHVYGKDAIKLMESITVADIQGLKENQVHSNNSKHSGAQRKSGS